MNNPQQDGPWVARLDLHGSIGGYAGNRPKTVRRSNSASCSSRKLLIRWRSLPDSNRCTSLERKGGAVLGSASAYSSRHARISELLQLYGVDPLTLAAQTGRVSR